MSSIFENPNFVLMEKVAGKPAISITKNGIGFSKQVLSRLKYSHFVLIYINKVDKQIAIKACERDTPGAIRFVPETKTKIDSLRWNSPSFKADIQNLVSKDISRENFVCEGDYFEDDDALLFDFTKARSLEK